MFEQSPSGLYVGQQCIISPSVYIENDVFIGDRVIADGNGIRLCSHARIESGAIIGEDVTIGSRSLVRAGSVVLKSVPPNAIVQGNPAYVVGYLSSQGTERFLRAKLIESYSFERNDQRPSKVMLGVGASSLHFMKQVIDSRGSLIVGEVTSQVPFEPKRYFVIQGVPTRELRGEHAHKECCQFLMCLKGSCRLLLDDGTTRCEVILDRPDIAVYMPEMIWGTQYCYSPDAILMVFASLPYDTGDYIRTYEEFRSLTG